MGLTDQMLRYRRVSFSMRWITALESVTCNRTRPLDDMAPHIISVRRPLL
jgi:hypothetical protein